MRRALVVATLVAGAGCGHSESEWQAQLGKYDQLAQQANADRAELEKQKARVKELTDQLQAMGVKLKDIDSMQAALQDYKKRAEMLERVKARFELLRGKLKKLTELGLEVSIRRNRMVVSLPGDVVFESGKDELSDAGKKILAQVAEAIHSDKALSERLYQVAGHTDSQRLVSSVAQFKDNWGLSLMRARQVLVFLTSPASAKGGGGGLDVAHWSASGYGATDPVANNGTKDGRQKNRRVEIVVLPDVEEMLDLKSFAGE